MVQAAVADVVGPAVAAEDPHALFHQLVGQAEQQFGFGRVQLLQFLLQGRDAFALVVNAGFVALFGVEDCRRQIVADLRRRVSSAVRWRIPSACQCETRKPRPNSALSSNSELHHAGPRPSAFLRVRRGRQVAAVNRGAAGGVGDDRAVAEQLASAS